TKRTISCCSSFGRSSGKKCPPCPLIGLPSDVARSNKTVKAAYRSARTRTCTCCPMCRGHGARQSDGRPGIGRRPPQGCLQACSRDSGLERCSKPLAGTCWLTPTQQVRLTIVLGTCELSLWLLNFN